LLFIYLLLQLVVPENIELSKKTRLKTTAVC